MAFDELSSLPGGETSAQIRARVIAAREIQHARFASVPGVHTNSQMTPRLIQQHCTLDDATKEMLRNAMTRYDMSARAYDRILKVARTIADLDSSASIQPHHMAEAITYRNLDRSSWGRTI